MHKNKDGFRFTFTNTCFIPSYYLDIIISDKEKIEGVVISADDTEEAVREKITKAVEEYNDRKNQVK